MNKHESKYFNTARLIDEALLLLLLKKDFELITVKDICAKAGVNRSTFYLHYETIDDVLKECIAYSNQMFYLKLKEKGKANFDIETKNMSDLIFIKEEYLIPYLEFVKDNKNLFKAVHNHPQLFDSENTYSKMLQNVFNPILKRFGFKEEEAEYMMEYYGKGTSAIILKWAENDCKEDISKIIELMMICIRPEIKGV